MNDSLSMTTFEMCFFLFFPGHSFCCWWRKLHRISEFGWLCNGRTFVQFCQVFGGKCSTEIPKWTVNIFIFYSAILRIRKLSFMEPVKFSMHHSSLNRYETWFLFHVRQYFHASHVLLLLLCSWKFWDVNLHLNGISVLYCTSWKFASCLGYCNLFMHANCNLHCAE
jgi:hypothetical protein